MKHAKKLKYAISSAKEKASNLNPKAYDVKKLIEEHPGPDVWIRHLEKDLMPFWKSKDACSLEKGLFRTYRDNTGKIIPDNPSKYPPEIKAALADKDLKGLIELDYNFVRAHSRQTYAYGVAFNMTGNLEYLKLCKQGAEALMNAFDNENGIFTRQNRKTGQWGEKYEQRNSQDLAYGITGLGMYYCLTRDEKALFKIMQAKEHIFNNYFSYGRGYFTWLPKVKSQIDDNVEIVAQLDQIYGYMIWLTPALPEPHQTEWKEWLKKIASIIITRFYSERYGFFWGKGKEGTDKQLGTSHTDFGHSVKTMWLIYEIGVLTNEMSFVNFAREKIDVILRNAYIEKTGSWARRFNADTTRDEDKEWWSLAELNQACAIMALNDPSYLEYLNKTYKYWFDYMVDKKHGEIWHFVSAVDNKPVLKYPKVHSWKTCFHSCEHALFGYLTASQIKNKEFKLYYAFKSEKEIKYNRVSPYLFRANITKYEISKKPIPFMENGNRVTCVSFYSLH
ncbi:MAG: hypothetical protein LBC85_10920 [Fibromonadaceae bacterium]|jgi:mannose/cellobiose epimerase-like protein (N-acyl-D-glucosamine 2-epimerase family)|nr:hypothetical protein [Fibromonadaceae bacterium]